MTSAHARFCPSAPNSARPKDLLLARANVATSTPVLMGKQILRRSQNPVRRKGRPAPPQDDKSRWENGIPARPKSGRRRVTASGETLMRPSDGSPERVENQAVHPPQLVSVILREQSTAPSSTLDSVRPKDPATSVPRGRWRRGVLWAHRRGLRFGASRATHRASDAPWRDSSVRARCKPADGPGGRSLQNDTSLLRRDERGFSTPNQEIRSSGS
jgi:hypothetical protein